MKSILLVFIMMFSGCSLSSNYCDNRKSNTLSYSLYQASPSVSGGLDLVCEGLKITNEAKNIYNELVENNVSNLINLN